MTDQTAHFDELRETIQIKYDDLDGREQLVLLKIGEAVVSGDSEEEIARLKNEGIKLKLQKSVVSSLLDSAEAMTRSI